MNTSPKNQADLLHTAKPRGARQPQTGEHVWTIRKVDGAVLACELRDNGMAGVEVHVHRDGEFLFSQRFLTRADALYDAAAIRAEHLAHGGTLVD